MVARGGGDGEHGAVVLPLQVVHGDVVAEHRPVEVGGHLEAGDRAGVDVNDDAVDHAHLGVADERILPRFQAGGAHLVAHHMEGVELAVVLLLGGDLLAVGRPLEDGAVGMDPSGIVGGVAEVLDAVGGELGFLAGGDVADPEVEPSNEGGALAVGAQDFGGTWAAPSHHAGHTGGGGVADGFANRCFQLAGVAFSRRVEGDRVSFGREVEGGERERVAAELGVGGGVEGSGQLGVIEERGAGLLDAVDEEEAGAGRPDRAVPELAVGCPGGGDLTADDEGVGVLAEHSDCAVVVGGGQRGALSGEGQGEGEG